jgi:hypothetical protein
MAQHAILGDAAKFDLSRERGFDPDCVFLPQTWDWRLVSLSGSRRWRTLCALRSVKPVPALPT